MKSVAKKILLAIPGFQAMCRVLTRRHVRTLMYHRFSQNETGNSRFTSAETLRSQLQYIVRNHPCWTPNEHLAALKGRRTWASCPVVVTVDDGYRDFYDVAFPVFREINVPVMLFVTTGFVDGSLLLWWDLLELILEKGKGRREPIEVEGKRVILDLTDDAGRMQVWGLLADRCRFLSHFKKELLLEKLSDVFGATSVDTRDERFMAVNWEEIRTMVKTVVSIGAHTVTHPILSRLEPAAAATEISESKKRLAEMGLAVNWFCYPQGGPADFNPMVREMVKKEGFTGSYIAYQDIDRLDDVYALSRYCVSENVVDFRWCLCGAEFLVLKLRKFLGKRVAVGELYWRGSQGLDVISTDLRSEESTG